MIPTAEQVNAYSTSRDGLVDGNEFVDHYTSKGWMIGSGKMKDWQAAVRTWENKARTSRGESGDDASSFLRLLAKASAKDPKLAFKSYDLFQVANEYSFSQSDERYTPSERSRIAYADKELWTYLKSKL